MFVMAVDATNSNPQMGQVSLTQYKDVESVDIKDIYQ